MDLLQILQDNFGLVATVLLLVAAAVFVGRRAALFQWANEVLFFAFDNAERHGILEGWSGATKLQHYLDIWRREYVKRYGDTPPESLTQYAIRQAEAMAIKEKTLRREVEAMADPDFPFAPEISD